MTKAGKRLIESAQQALDFAEGKSDQSQYRINIPSQIDVKQIREGMNMTQQEFAKQFGFELHSLEDWERGCRVPSGLAKNFLILLYHVPELVREVLLLDYQS